MICIGTENTGSCMIAGPGHKPAIPHPIPKHIDPNKIFQSINLLFGFHNYKPKNVFFLN